MDKKFLRLTLEPNGFLATDRPVAAGPVLIDIGLISVVFEHALDKDKPPTTRVWLSNGAVFHVKDSVDYVQGWLSKAPMTNSVIINENETEESE